MKLFYKVVVILLVIAVCVLVGYLCIAHVQEKRLYQGIYNPDYNPGDEPVIRDYKSYEIPQVTRENFREVIEKSHDTPVFVKFTAVWCGPCKALIDSYKHAAKQFNEVEPGYAVLMECDYDMYRGSRLEKAFEAAGVSNINEVSGGIPRLALFYKGEVKSVACGGVKTLVFKKKRELGIEGKEKTSSYETLEIAGVGLSKHRKVGSFQRLIRELVELQIV